MASVRVVPHCHGSCGIREITNSKGLTIAAQQILGEHRPESLIMRIAKRLLQIVVVLFAIIGFGCTACMVSALYVSHRFKQEIREQELRH